MQTEFTYTGLPVSPFTNTGLPAEPLELSESLITDIVELFKLQFLRDSPYGGNNYSAFSNEPGALFMPTFLSFPVPSGSCDQITMTVNGGNHINTLADVCYAFEGDYKNQASIMLWNSMRLFSADSPSIFRDEVDIQFLERDAYSIAIIAECIKEAMTDCFLWKWTHNWARPEQLVRTGLAEGNTSLLEAVTTDQYALHAPLKIDDVPQLTELYKHPSHPSFPAGHGVCVGATVTALRALVRPDAELPGSERPVTHELASAARAVAYARMGAGIHYRRDMTSGLGLGEEVARNVLSGYGLTPGDDIWFPPDAATPAIEREVTFGPEGLQVAFL